MKISTNNLIIFSLYSLHLLCISKASTSSDSCYFHKCSANSPSIYFPFRIKDLQPQSCGSPGFEVFCNSTGGIFLQLQPFGPTLLVEYIYYSIRLIELSDPNNCLPRTLISLDLVNTPFQIGESSTFRLYNCSGDHYIDHEDRIECLSSSSDYTVLGAGDDNTVDDPNWTLIKIVHAPGSYNVTNLNIQALFGC